MAATIIVDYSVAIITDSLVKIYHYCIITSWIVRSVNISKYYFFYRQMIPYKLLKYAIPQLKFYQNEGYSSNLDWKNDTRECKIVFFLVGG